MAQRQQEEQERMRREEEARQKEVQRQRETRRKQVEAAEKRAAEERQRQREAEERRAREEAERQRLEAERKLREAAEAERKRQEMVRRRQEQASQVLARMSRQHLQRSFLCAWQALAAEVREQRRLKEERREQALAACIVGTRKRLTPRKSLSPLPPKKAQPQPVEAEEAPLDITPALTSLSGRSPHACNLFFKLAFVHSGAPPARESTASLWLRSSLLGTARDREEPLVKLKSQIGVPGRLPVVLRTGIRDVTKSADDSAAMAGVTALLLFVASQDQPRHIGDRLRALLSHLPASSPQGPPLLVLVESEELVEPLKTWLAEETSAGTGQRIGRTKVAVLPPPDRSFEGQSTAKRRVLLQSVHWLADRTPPQPNLRRATLAELARECLEATLVGIRGHHAAEPLHFVAAYNRAMHMLVAGVRNTATTAGSLMGWPPADCCMQNEHDLLPKDWWQESMVRAAEQALCGAHLPDFHHSSGPPDEQVRRYLETEARTVPLTSPEAKMPWRQALQDAFQLRLLALDAAPPTVVMVPLPLPASDEPGLSSPEERLKRKWAEDDASPSGSTLTGAKLQRTFDAEPAAGGEHVSHPQDPHGAGCASGWSTGTPQPMRQPTPSPPSHPAPSPHGAFKEAFQPPTHDLGNPDLAFSTGTATTPFGDPGTDDSLSKMEEEKAESEALTASLRALLAIDDQLEEGQQTREPPSYEGEVDATANFTRFLNELRGGF